LPRSSTSHNNNYFGTVSKNLTVSKLFLAVSKMFETVSKKFGTVSKKFGTVFKGTSEHF
jgi:hypothetical protein